MPEDWKNTISKTAKSAALYSDICNVGKTVEASKKRVTWRVRVENGQEHEISLTHSLASGKKVLRVDGTQIHKSRALLAFGEWEYIFHVKGGCMFHCMIKPSTELNDMYDLIVDGVSFRRLPKSVATTRTTNTKFASVDDFAYGTTSSRSLQVTRQNSSRGSEGPWTCPACTLINESPTSKLCGACESPRPLGDHNPQNRVATKKPAPLSRTGSITSKATSSRTSSPRTSSPRTSSNKVAKKENSVVDLFNFEAEVEDVRQADPVAPMTAPDDDWATSLSTVNFATLAPEPAPVQPSLLPPMQPTNVAPVMNSSDLWSSKMVNLDLNSAVPTSSNTIPSVTGEMSIEQARRDSNPASPMHYGTMQPSYSQQQFPAPFGPQHNAPPQQQQFSTQQFAPPQLSFAQQHQQFAPQQFAPPQQQQQQQQFYQQPPPSQASQYNTMPAQINAANTYDPFAALN